MWQQRDVQRLIKIQEEKVEAERLKATEEEKERLRKEKEEQDRLEQ